MKEENENVVILDCEDLTSSIVTKGTVSGVIHKQLLNKLTEQICGSVLREKQRRGKGSTEQNINDFRKNDNFPLNYYIAGKRGSGKTTFLHQLGKKLKYNDYNDVKIKSLLWYDPSQSFGVPNDLFITVAAAIKTRMRELACEPYRQKEYNSNRYRFCEEKLDKLDKAIVRFSCEREALSGMSEYRASALSSEDPEMNNNVRENFRESMKLLCELEGVDAFVLVIDDVDIRTKQCCHVLEDLRLYLSNDYLIVLMAGDRESSLEHVRERFFKEYDIEYHRADKQGKEARMESIVSHAAQYFVKLFPVRQQFELRNLYTLMNANSLELKLKYGGEEEFLRIWVKDLFEIAISKNDIEVRSYVDTFMTLPLRNLIQIIEYWIREGMWVKLGQFKTADSDSVKNKARESEVEQIKQIKSQIEFLVRSALNHSLHDQVQDFSNNYEAFDSDDERVYYAFLLHLCQQTGDYEHRVYYLSDEDELGPQYRYLTLVLAANLKRHIRDLKGFLSYLFYGPASAALYGKALGQFYAMKASKNPVLESEDDLRKNFEEYMRIGSWRNPSRWARHANMIWCYDPNNYLLHSGVFRICDQSELCMIQRFIHDELHGMHYSLDRYPLEFTICFLVSVSKSGDQDDSLYVSIYSYLAYIFRCIEICEQGYGFDDGQKDGAVEYVDETAQQLRTMTLEYIPIESCRHPGWQIKESTRGMGYHCTDNIVKLEDRKYDELYECMKKIVKWYTDMQKLLKDRTAREDDITPHTMGDIWITFYQRVQIISHSAKPSDKTFEEARNIFNKIIECFKDEFLTGKEMKTANSMTEFYKAAISSFPLTKYLKYDCSFAKMTGNE